jgi:pimeloyl-ACP methyl ester carboxylesterase
MMGSPDDPVRSPSYRRGSPVYRAERIEAPLLILHGRKDKRVVPLMTERMVEALESEAKRYEHHAREPLQALDLVLQGTGESEEATQKRRQRLEGKRDRARTRGPAR